MPVITPRDPDPVAPDAYDAALAVALALAGVYQRLRAANGLAALRCGNIRGLVVCSRKAGHIGRHRNGQVTW